MTPDEMIALSAREAVGAMRNGDFTALNYCEALLARCAEGAELNAFITLDPEAVRAQARAADARRVAGELLGPLHGLPVPVKDSINTADLPTTAGTAALRNFRPASDAPVVDTTNKLHPGQRFAPLTLPQLDRADYTFGAPGAWQAMFVIRGQHCPICKTYLGEIEKRRATFTELGVSLAAVSADNEAQTRLTAEATKLGFPLLYGLSEAAMRKLGLYISEPRSTQETDHRFPEPALFVVNAEGFLQLVDIANAPFLRPDLDRLVGGLRFVIDKHYPIRGTHK